MIDVNATKERIHAKGFTLPGYARAKGFDPAKFPSIFFNGIKMPDEVREVLQADELLVEVADAA